MVGLRAAMDTYRYWNDFDRTCARNADKIDRASLLEKWRASRKDIDSLLADFGSRGVAMVQDYWSPEKCESARSEIDRLIIDYPKAIRVFSGGSDKRMFGVEAVSPLLSEFHHDPFLRGVGEALGGLALYNFATLGARIDATGPNNGSGDGWHRDGHGYQFKSILYLSNVAEDNGPFEFLPGSHKRWRAAFDTAVGELPPAPGTRYAAKAGTLLLVNTAGIHRGRPLRSGSRYALTNYYYHPFQIGESRIEQFAPMMPGTAERIRSDLGLTGVPTRERRLQPV
jgi:Phytanoyl-CoA dioxygenase (PhyH)